MEKYETICHTVMNDKWFSIKLLMVFCVADGRCFKLLTRAREMRLCVCAGACDIYVA